MYGFYDKVRIWLCLVLCVLLVLPFGSAAYGADPFAVGSNIIQDDLPVEKATASTDIFVRAGNQPQDDSETEAGEEPSDVFVRAGSKSPETTEPEVPLEDTEPEIAIEPETSEMSLDEPAYVPIQQETATKPAPDYSAYAGDYDFYCQLLTPEYMEEEMEMQGYPANDVGNRYVWLPGLENMKHHLNADGTGYVQSKDGARGDITWEITEGGIIHLQEKNDSMMGTLIDGVLTLILSDGTGLCFVSQGAQLPEEVLTFEEYFLQLYSMQDVVDKYAVEDGKLSRSESDKLVETGLEYYYGTGEGGFDIDLAYQYFLEAAQQFNGRGYYYLGKTILLSADDDRYEKAMMLFQDAATLGCAYGLIGQGDMYCAGRPVEQDYVRALELYQQALDQGCLDANIDIGRIYRKGNGVEADGRKALEYFSNAADSSDYGCRNAARWEIANLYMDGAPGVDQDLGQALLWLSRAAKENFAAAFTTIGYMYYYGLGVDENIQESIAWLKRGAACGSEASMYNLGQLYMSGHGVEKDADAAFSWYIKSANLGYAYAMQRVGYFYEYGIVSSIDYGAARTWYTKALASADCDQTTREKCEEALERLAGYGQQTSQGQDAGFETIAYETQPWEDPFFIGYTQDGIPQYSNR